MKQPRRIGRGLPLRLPFGDLVQVIGLFKVLFDDWRDKVRDEQVFCPFCRHNEEATEWNTPEQVEHIKSAGLAEMARLVNGALDRGVKRSRPQHFGGGLFKMSMSL